MMKTLTQDELCRKLAGYEKREILCSEPLQNGDRKHLILIFRLAGYFDTVLEIKAYWVQWGDKIQPFTEINEALKFYAELR